MVNKDPLFRPSFARRAGLLGSLAALAVGVGLYWQPSPAQVAGTSAQGVASLTVMSAGTGTNANDSGYASGQDLQWVGTYQQLELSSIASQQHVLSFGSDPANAGEAPYVSGSTIAPPGYGKAWNLGSETTPSWSFSEPASGTSIRGVRYTYKPTVNPPILRTVDFSGTGDGYRVIPYTLPLGGENVAALFVINHHTDLGYIKCLVAATSQTCPTWPRRGAMVGATAGESLFAYHSVFDVLGPAEAAERKRTDDVFFKNPTTPTKTPVKVTEFLDQKTGRLYFPAGKGSGAAINVNGVTQYRYDVGVLCADLIKKESCGFIKTGLSSRLTQSHAISGLGVTENEKMLFLADQGSGDDDKKIHCFDLKAKSACAGQPYDFDAIGNNKRGNYNKSTNYLSSSTVGNITFIAYNYFDFPHQKTTISCFDASTNKACDGFGIKFLSGSYTGVLPKLSTSGEIAGVCAIGRNVCFNMQGIAETPAAGTALATWLAFSPTFNGAIMQNYVTQKTRVYNFDDAIGRYKGNHLSSNGTPPRDSDVPAGIVDRVLCYDFATNDFCFNDKGVLPTAPYLHSSGNPLFYAVSEDPDRSGCVWALGDRSIAQVWDGTTGGACTQKTVTYSIDTVPVNFYGFDKTINGDVAYKRVVVSNLTASFVDASANHGVRASVHAINDDGSTGAALVTDVELTAPSGSNKDYVLDLTQFASGNTALETPLTYKNYPRLRTVVTIYRDSRNPDWPADVLSDVIWSGPPLQFSVQTKAPDNDTPSCLAASFVQSGVFVANSTVSGKTATTRGSSNALVENGIASSTGPVMLQSSYLGYERANPQTVEGTPAVAMYPFYDNNLFTGNIGFFDVTSGTPGAADPTQAKLADVHGLTGLISTGRSAYTSLANGDTVKLQWSDLDDDWKDALNRNRGGILDNLGEDRVNYLLGERSKEIGRPASNGIFHARSDRGTPCTADMRCDFASKSEEVPNPGTMTSSGLALMLTGVMSGYSEALAPGYAAFQAQSSDDKTGRQSPVVFANSNDGYLYAHAVTPGKGKADAGTLKLSEVFTYLPRRLRTLMSGYTDRSFAQLGAFPYLNDGSPLLADFCRKDCDKAAQAEWRTALVSSFGRGFPGGYAVDVTDATKPGETPVQALWEFTDHTPVSTPAAQPDPARYLGKQSAFPQSSYSNASLSTQVVRVKVDNTVRWAWIIGNGYNSPASDAAGLTKDAATAVLYIVFMDGAKDGVPEYVGIQLKGTEGMPNGLSTPNAVDVTGDGTADLVYAGDLQGRMWRIDLTGLKLDTGLPSTAANVVMQAVNAKDVQQPIVGAPAVVPVGNTHRMVVFSSGRPEITSARYLDVTGQFYSLIGVKDSFMPGAKSGTTAPPLRASCALRELGAEVIEEIKIKTGPSTAELKNATARSVTGKDMGTSSCWVLDLSSGETGIGNAVFNPIGHAVDLLSVESPSASNSCTPGRSWINRLNALTGKASGVDLNANGVISATESAYAGLSVARSTGIVINNGKETSTGSTARDSGSLGGAGISSPNAGRVWWREL